MSFTLSGQRFYTLCVGEKGVFRFNMRTRGRAGHASVPALGDNALLKLPPLLEALRSQPDPEPTPEGLEFLGALLGEDIDASGLDAALGRKGVAIDRQGASGRDAHRVGDGHDVRAEATHLFLEQADRVVQLVAAE
jgi:acetylornithine deacetylase/succinyl-diaminopimelate desuccinylase-like protein